MSHHDLLYQAVNSEFGIEIETDSPVALRAQLYAEIREAKIIGNSDFNILSLHLSPIDPTRYLWINKNDNEKKVRQALPEKNN